MPIYTYSPKRALMAHFLLLLRKIPASFIPLSAQFYYSIIGSLVVAATSLASVRIYTELLSKSEFGFTMMMAGGVTLLDSLIVMAFNQTLLSICAGITNPDIQRQVAAGLGLRLFMALTLLILPITLITILAAPLIKLSAVTTAVLLLALLYLAEEIAKFSMLSPLVSCCDYYRSSIWSAAEACTTLIFTTIIIIYIRADGWGFLAGLLSSRLLCTIAFLFAYFEGKYFLRVDHALAEPFIRRSLEYGLPVSAMGPIGWVGAYLDRYVISATVGLAGAGLYTAIAGLVGRPFLLASSILTNFFRPALFQGQKRAALHWIIAAAAVGYLGHWHSHFSAT